MATFSKTHVIGFERGKSAATLVQVAANMLTVMRMEGKNDKARFIKAGLAITSRNPKAYGDNHHHLAMEDALQRGDTKAAVAHTKTSLGPGWMKNSSEINVYTWWCFQNKINLEEARDLAEKGTAMAAPGTGKANILDTWAELENALGNPAKALILSRKALTELPDNPAFKKQVIRFEKLNAKNTN